MRIYPEHTDKEYSKKIIDFKKEILSNIEQNLNDYQIFKIKHKEDSDFILVKKNSIHDNVLKSTVKVNKAEHLKL